MWPVGREPSSALSAAPDQFGVWSVDSAQDDFDAAPVGHTRVWSSDGGGWVGAPPAVPDRSAAREYESAASRVPAVPARLGSWLADRVPSRVPAVAPGPPEGWPIDRPLTGAFPAVPAWGTPLHIGPDGSRRTQRVLSGRARRDRMMRVALAMAMCLLAGLVAWTWVTGGGVQQIRAGDTVLILRAAGHLAALLASALLLVQIVLMARLPALENVLGRDRVVRLHGKVGFASFILILAHIAIATLAYAGADLSRVRTTFMDLTREYPGMLMAVVGTIAIVVVVLTSPRMVRTRLSYESWHLLHLWAYLGAGLAVPHQLWTGKDFLRSPILTDFWWAAWGLAFAVVILWRLLIPLVRSIRHDVRVAGVVREGPGTVSVYMTGRRLDELAEPGQFLVWRFMDRPGWIRANPFSISAAPRPNRLRITVREAGDGTRSLATLEPGTRVLVEGGYGRLAARARTHRKIAFIGAGAGLAPLRSLAEGLAYAPGEATLLERCSGEPYLPQELEWLAHVRGLRLIRLSGRRRSRHSWVGDGYDGDSDSEVIRGWLPDLEDHDVYLCGPPAWSKSVRRALRKAGLPSDQLHVEAFGW